MKLRHAAATDERGGAIFAIALPLMAVSTLSDNSVFVVDDDDAVRESLAVLLETSGYDTEAFSSGTEFLEALDKDQAACILLDLRMPGMDGMAVQRELASRGNIIPVVMLTGHGDVAIAVEAMKAGAFEFIEKPADEETLVSAIERAAALARRNFDEERELSELRGRYERLTDRERDVLEHLVAGRLNKIIAYELGISVRTVEIHRRRVIEKMAAESLSHLVRMALQLGIDPGATV